MADEIDLTPFIKEFRQVEAGIKKNATAITFTPSGNSSPLGCVTFQFPEGAETPEVGESVDLLETLDRLDEEMTRAVLTPMLAWSDTTSDPLADVRALQRWINSDEYQWAIAEQNRQLAEQQAEFWRRWEIMVREEAEERGITYEERVREIWRSLTPWMQHVLMGGVL